MNDGMTVQEKRLARHYDRVANACPTGKLMYAKLREAQSEASRLNKRAPLRGPRTLASTYQCRTCGNWHVGRRREDS